MSRARALCGGVHVLDEIGVEGLLRPEVGRSRTSGLSNLHDAAVGPQEEYAVEDGRGSGGYGACYGSSVPLITARGEKVVRYCEEAEG